MSAADMDAALAERVARTRTVLAERGVTGSRIRRSAIAATVTLAVLGGAAWGSSASADFRAQHSANAVQLAALETRLDDARSLASQSQADPEVRDAMTSAVDEATRAAKAAARAQRRFAVLAQRADAEPSVGDGVPRASELAAVEHRRRLARWFAPESFVVDDEVAYRFDTAQVFGPEEIDPRYPWYLMRISGVPAPADAARWEVSAVVPEFITSPAGSISSGTSRVVWIDSASADERSRGEAPGVPLAWASATYDPETKTFNDLRVSVTSAGEVYQ